MTRHNRSRCPACGLAMGTWHKQSIIEACRRWVAEHGQPPTVREWKQAGPAHPNNSHVRMVFGTWNAMVEAAGFPPRARHRSTPPQYTREQVIQALFEWHFKHGRLPYQREWNAHSPDRPSYSQARRLFGSWNAAVVAAGYTPRKLFRSEVGYQHQAGATTRALERVA